jgi:broad specificity phosphatase PhoE
MVKLFISITPAFRFLLTFGVQRGYPFPDPPLTEKGYKEAMGITIDFKPDLIMVSPMRRTIQTAFTAFPAALKSTVEEERIPIEVWPDLREAHDAICNHGSPTQVLKEEFPDLDFSECKNEWTYETHTRERAEKRAEVVRQRLKNHPAQNIVCITHRGFIEYLIESHIFANCGMFQSPLF